ncbi:MAG: hypothetical protein LBI27_09350 [Clostridiales bacterium]|jgi:hypothetical protein|nr:hypothetical protein [Clostridiales bacterium]
MKTFKYCAIIAGIIFIMFLLSACGNSFKGKYYLGGNINSLAHYDFDRDGNVAFVYSTEPPEECTYQIDGNILSITDANGYVRRFEITNNRKSFTDLNHGIEFIKVD